jgi:predicted alpha/beta hydrolase family esterase
MELADKTRDDDATLLIVPGLRGAMPQHWQSLLEAEVPGARSVPPMDVDGLNCMARAEAIGRALDAIDGPVILVAHSAGVLMVAHWAALDQGRRPIAGALLAAPPDLDAEWPANYPPSATLRATGWAPLPPGPLPFPSILAASANDCLCGIAASERMAARWGSTLVELGEVGHLNPAAGFGPWPMARRLIDSLRLVAK